MSIVWRCLALHSPGAVQELLDEVGCPGRQFRLYVESSPHCALPLKVVDVFRLMFMYGPIQALTARPTIVGFRVAWAPKSVVPWEAGPAPPATACHRTGRQAHGARLELAIAGDGLRQNECGNSFRTGVITGGTRNRISFQIGTNKNVHALGL